MYNLLKVDSKIGIINIGLYLIINAKLRLKASISVYKTYK